MSNRQLDDRNEEGRDRAIATELGITYEELLETSFEIDTNESNDGLIYNYSIRFDESSPKYILDKISGLENNQIDIDLSDFDGKED